MKKIITLLFYTFFSQLVAAHPGIGIVKDRKGNIYYTDLEQIWKIDRDGKKNIVVPNVHSHELYIDSADNLFGEHLWYNGEQLNTWGHYVWCLKNDGTLVKIKEPSPGFLEDYSFVRDEAGNMYWAERFKISRIKKKTPDGTVSTIAEGKFKDIRWMHATLQGSVYFVDLNDLYKIDRQGKLTLLAKSLEGKRVSDHSSLKHHIFGIWLDKNNNVYLAVTGENLVKKITPDGIVSSFASSSGGWSPTGGVFNDDGNLWLMEWNETNAIRVRKVTPKELLVKSPFKNSLITYSLPILVIAAIAIVMVARYSRKTINKPLSSFFL